MFLISINFDETKIPDYFNDIHNQKCIKYSIDDDFLVATDTNGISHFYKKTI